MTSIFIPLIKCYFILKEPNGTSDSGLIPERPQEGCPANTYGCSGNDCNRPKSCFCEEHCSWARCRLVDSPEKCLEYTESIWNWDAKKIFWVAQMGGIIYKSNSFIVSKILMSVF